MTVTTAVAYKEPLPIGTKIQTAFQMQSDPAWLNHPFAFTYYQQFSNLYDDWIGSRYEIEERLWIDPKSDYLDYE